MEPIKQQFTTERFMLTKDNITRFTIMPNRRLITDIHVNRILRALTEGDNPLGVIVINKRGTDMVLVDGNHRIEAVKRFFNSTRNDNSKAKVECTMEIYENLTDNEMLELYDKKAKTKPQTYEDHLQIYKDEITFWKLLQEDFPVAVTIYPTQTSVKFRTLLNCLYTSKLSREAFTPKQLSKDNLVPFAKNLLYEDYKSLKDFILFFTQTFGNINPRNMFNRNHFFIPLYDIWLKNKSYSTMTNFQERFKRVIGQPDLLMFADAGGREQWIKIRSIMVGYMNYHISRSLFI